MNRVSTTTLLNICKTNLQKIQLTYRDYLARTPEGEEIRPGVFLYAKDKERGAKISYTRCQDCRIADPISFRVHDALWRKAGLDKGIICPECFSKRLGRPLRVNDLSHFAMNETLFFGAALALNQLLSEVCPVDGCALQEGEDEKMECSNPFCSSRSE